MRVRLFRRLFAWKFLDEWFSKIFERKIFSDSLNWRLVSVVATIEPTAYRQTHVEVLSETAHPAHFRHVFQQHLFIAPQVLTHFKLFELGRSTTLLEGTLTGVGYKNVWHAHIRNIFIWHNCQSPFPQLQQFFWMFLLPTKIIEKVLDSVNTMRFILRCKSSTSKYS